jgi:hypothetical protein
MRQRLIALLVISPILLSSQFTTSTSFAFEQGTPCGIYKNNKNEVIAGVKFPKGDYQIYTYGMPCNKVLGKKGILATFLNQKDKDPLPKPWRYASDTVGAQGFSASGVGFRVQLITKKPTSTAQLTPTALQALKNITAQLKSATQSNLKIELALAKDSHKLFAELLPIIISEDAKFWSNFYDPKVVLPVAIALPGDSDWLNQNFAKYSYSLHPQLYERIKNQDKEQMIFDAQENPSTGSVLYFVIDRDKAQQPAWVKSVITHEFVHVVQIGLTKARNGRIPCWSTEGSAVFYGNAITASKSESPESDYSELRKNWLAMQNLKKALSGKSKTEILDLLKKSESDFRVCAEPLYLGYSAGSLMTEVLIAEHGHEKFVQWWIKSRDNDWRKEFASLFGMEIDTFYTNVAIPYILKDA